MRNKNSPAKFDKSYQKPIAFSVALHLAMILAMLVGWQSHSEVKPISMPRHINAVVVDASELPSAKRKVEDEKRRKKEAAEKKKKIAEDKAKKVQKDKRVKEAKRKKEENRRKAEAERKKALKEKQLQLKKKKEEAKKKAQDERRKKERLEKQKKERLDKERKEKERKEKEALDKEKERQKRRAEQEKQLLETMRQAEQDSLAREAERESERIRAEQDRQQALSAQRLADVAEVDRFSALIGEKIKQKWHEPPNVEFGMQVKLRLNLAPNGELVSAKIVEASGNSAFDQSALSAAYAVGTYPVPGDKRVFEEKFRHFVLLFNPKD